MPFPLPLLRTTALACATALCATAAFANNGSTNHLSAIQDTSASTSAPAPAVDVTRIVEVNGSERIDYAGKLRMLSQRIPASACNWAAGIGGWESIGYLQASVGEFNRIMNALENGDVFISIRAPERDRRVLGRINQMNTAWEPIKTDMRAMVEANDPSIDQVQYTVQAAPKLLDITQALVGDLIGEYADPTALLAADAVVLDIVGRQRMMPQIISKSACMAMEGIDAADARTELAEAMALYDLSMGALQNGMPEVGVTPPPNDATRTGLDEIAGRWQAVRPLLEQVATGTVLSNADREHVYSEMNHLTAAMNTVSADYAKASKLGL
ncbi:type IV pili methyl-accepting chemotaxis transducer N-terminal domain-containing protein [Jannaschia pohangensis]|uniref:Type IV pili methyl-accepting chemotaxis transducer N-term n=1 Tax=Jannaschia pohangensis TaxID=390807 RepID=A0A1I3V439_9RHOB|nr:type IV pili methyl-accepting chemotaxis transducer N-terminal domain-containing protein [Jannaschia pohangensis]SFJ88901.1 Type IV pili methyl-accepting chemotaxis transducer N-term [Jannaschia pohangensis]